MPAQAAALPDGVQEILGQSGVSADSALSFTLADLWALVRAWAGDTLGAPLTFARQATLFLALACAVGLLAGGGAWRDCLDLVTVLGFGVISLAPMVQLISAVDTAAKTCQTYLAGFIPVFSGVALLAGQTAGVTVYTTMFCAMSAFLAFAIEKLLLPLLQIYFCFAVSAAVWGDSGIGQAASVFARCFSLALKGCGALFTFVLGLQNALAQNSDRAALRLGQNLLTAAIPVVGDAAAAALGGAAAAVGVLKGSLALAAVAALGAAFVPVLLRCGLYWLAFSGAGMLASGCGQKRCAQICNLFAEGARLCGAVLVLYGFLVVLSTSLLLMGGNGG